MSIITISRGSYSKGKEVAEKLAAKLNYECLSREIILETCAEFNIPEVKLVRALHDSPSVLERFQHGKERYLSYHKYELLKHVKSDNVVYHGLAGQYILKDIPHVLKVRIISDMESRIVEDMKRQKISRDEARYTIKKDDEERRKWGIQVHGTDTWDSRLYDIVLHIGQLTVEDAVEILYNILQKTTFQTNPESQDILEKLTVEAKVHSLLVHLSPLVHVNINDGHVLISNVTGNLQNDSGLREDVIKKIKKVETVDKVSFQVPVSKDTGHINPYYNI
ncbi:MAG: cytidylate kinase-like family protein [Desulfotalea sp.]